MPDQNPMANCYAKGSEYAHIPGPPVNEDYSVVVQIQSVAGGIAVGKKVWDESGTKLFNARLKYHGRDGTPHDGELKPGEYTIFYRVGAFNSAGTLLGPELRTENPEGYSWVCYVTPSLILIKDMGGAVTSRQGQEVYRDGLGALQTPPNAETLLMRTLDPVSMYHESTPPWTTGRVYWGYKLQGNPDYYLVFLPAKGDEATTLSDDSGGVTFTISVDGSGHVLDFTAV
jgi:hypothetical protein